MSARSCLRILVFLGSALSQACGDTTEHEPPGWDWPTGTPEAQGFDSEALADLVADIDERNLPVDSLTLVRRGQIVLDAYFYPYLGDRAHDMASVAKSVSSTLVGIATDQGLLDGVEQPVWPLFPDLAPVADEGRAAIELEHLLSMTSGLDCGFDPSEPELYEMIDSDDWVRYALELPLANTPGDVFAYCSSGSHLLSALITQVTGQSALAFAQEHLFEPLGIDDVVWLADPQGFTRGWGDLQLYPRDAARIGQLFLNEGEWNGTRVVSAEWVRAVTESRAVAGDDGTGYGYQWWLLPSPFDGIYEARGRGGQAIVVWPDRELVAVFTGRGVDVRGEVATGIVAALQSDEPLPENAEGNGRLAAAIEHATEPPAARPVPPLPDVAAQISGTVYRLAENSFGVRCISLAFTSPSDVSFDLDLDEASFTMPVGMDGVPRFSDDGPSGIPIGLVGEWVEPAVFVLDYDEVAGPNHLRITTDFSDPAAVELLFEDPGGYFPSQQVAGGAAEACR